MGKPTICIGKNKGADQRLCFRFTDSTIPLLPKVQNFQSSHLLCLYSLVCVGPVQKPHCWFSHEVAHFVFIGSPAENDSVSSVSQHEEKILPNHVRHKNGT